MFEQISMLGFSPFMIKMLSENQSSIDHVHGSEPLKSGIQPTVCAQSVGSRRGPRLDIVAFHGPATV